MVVGDCFKYSYPCFYGTYAFVVKHIHSHLIEIKIGKTLVDICSISV